MRFTSFLPVAAIALCLTACSAAHAQHGGQNDQAFNAWLAGFRQEASQQAISDSVLNQALSNISPDDHVLDLDQEQPENTLTLDQYLKQVVNRKMVAEAREKYAENRALLKTIGAKYGVPPQYIVALWGIESRFGRHMGGFSTVESLATLAYDGRRSDFFRQELLNALVIIQQGHISAGDMEGSWAGAMGQCQFMPSSFLKYAVDYDGDGHKDIWHTKADVFASIANYLSSEGWNPKKGWGTKAHPRNNYDVVMKWNRSRYFAIAVGTLADSIVRGKR